MKFQVKGEEVEFFRARMNKAEVIGVQITKGQETHTEWSDEPASLPTSDLEAEIAMVGFEWKIVNHIDDFRILKEG